MSCFFSLLPHYSFHLVHVISYTHTHSAIVISFVTSKSVRCYLFSNSGMEIKMGFSWSINAQSIWVQTVRFCNKISISEPCRYTIWLKHNYYCECVLEYLISILNQLTLSFYIPAKKAMQIYRVHQTTFDFLYCFFQWYFFSPLLVLGFPFYSHFGLISIAKTFKYNFDQSIE